MGKIIGEINYKSKISDALKLENVKIELDLLSEMLKSSEVDNNLMSELEEVNLSLWDIEDDIRVCEKNKDFGDKFIELARSVYITNDKRFEVKNKINNKFNSLVKEEKSYEKYT